MAHLATMEHVDARHFNHFSVFPVLCGLYDISLNHYGFPFIKKKKPSTLVRGCRTAPLLPFLRPPREIHFGLHCCGRSMRSVVVADGIGERLSNLLQCVSSDTFGVGECDSECTMISVLSLSLFFFFFFFFFSFLFFPVLQSCFPRTSLVIRLLLVEV